jgi:hypothetical protein
VCWDDLAYAVDFQQRSKIVGEDRTAQSYGELDEGFALVGVGAGISNSSEAVTNLKLIGRRIKRDGEFIESESSTEAFEIRAFIEDREVLWNKWSFDDFEDYQDRARRLPGTRCLGPDPTRGGDEWQECECWIPRSELRDGYVIVGTGWHAGKNDVEGVTIYYRMYDESEKKLVGSTKKRSCGNKTPEIEFRITDDFQSFVSGIGLFHEGLDMRMLETLITRVEE